MQFAQSSDPSIEPTPYRPLYKPNQVICGTGQTAIVTGWTVKQSVVKHLEPHEFAAIGQLYSPTRGISFLLRNLLVNPHVRYLVVLNATREDQNAGGCLCLMDFFRNGFHGGLSDTGRPCWVIQSEIAGYIDAEIPDHALTLLRDSLTVTEATTISAAVGQIKANALQPLVPYHDQPLEFSLSTLDSDQIQLPGPYYGHRIEGPTIADTWVKIIHRIRTTGLTRPTAYDGPWQELVDVVAIVTAEPPDFYIPEPNYLPCNRPFIQEYVSQMLDDRPRADGVKYTYGTRLRSWFGKDQIQQVVQKLAQDVSSTRAVMSLWDVNDPEFSDSPPCLNHIWVRVADSELSLTATFRSNDMFSAWPANAIGLRALQQHLRDELVAITGQALTLGALITISQSAHIYDDCWENADRVIRMQYPRITQQRDFADPSGSFTIAVQNNEIFVEHLTPGAGEVVNHFSGKSAKQLYQRIAQDCPGLEIEHALYLGTELQKAEVALHSNQTIAYDQDKPLQL
jgi:thymidylate synthase